MKHKRLHTNKLLQDVKASYVVTAFLFMCPEIRLDEHYYHHYQSHAYYITVKTTKSNMDIPSLWFAANSLSRFIFFLGGNTSLQSCPPGLREFFSSLMLD